MLTCDAARCRRGEPVLLVDDSYEETSLDPDYIAEYGAVSIVHGQWQRDRALFRQRQSAIYTLSEINTRVARMQSLQLPGDVPYDLKLELVRESLQHLPRVVRECFKGVAELLHDFEVSEAYKIFYDCCGVKIRDEAGWAYSKLKEELSDKTQAILDGVLEAQTSCIFTMHVSPLLCVGRQGNNALRLLTALLLSAGRICRAQSA